MRGIQGFEKKGMYIILTCSFICFMIGSFCDYQLSNAIFDKENIICIFLAAYGQLPVSLGMSIFGTLLIYVCKKEWCWRSVGAVIAGVLLNAMAIFMCLLEPTLYFENMPMILNILIAFTLLTTVNVLIIRYVKDIEKEEIKRFIKFGLFIIFSQLIIINVIKIPWGRPRMRMIAETPEAAFQPWWIIGSNVKATLMAQGVAAEEFKSFPSGHSACSACILIFSVLPLMKARYQKYTKLVFCAGLAFAVIVAFSRIVMGAHFLSDVTVGFSVCYLLMVGAYRYFYGKKEGSSYEQISN